MVKDDATVRNGSHHTQPEGPLGNDRDVEKGGSVSRGDLLALCV